MRRVERMERVLRDLLVEYQAAEHQSTMAAAVLFGAEHMRQKMNAERARQYIARIEHALADDNKALDLQKSA